MIWSLARSLVATTLCWAVLAASPAAAQSKRWGEGYFPNLTVTDQNGRQLRFYDDVIKGKIVVVSFVFTSCKDICPLTTARLSQVGDKLGGDLGKQIHFVSLSVDPVNDTPERLKAFATAFQAQDGWLFLTAPLEDMRRIAGAFGERMRSLSEHRNEVILGNDATGEWARNSAFGDLDRLVIDIRSMDPSWRLQAPPHRGSGIPGHAFEAAPGAILFKKLCAPCHTVAAGDRVGPDLYGVTKRRSREWLGEFIRHPDRVRAAQDPVALALASSFPGVRMPSLGLTDNDAADLVSYLEGRTKLLDMARREAEAAAPASAHAHHQ